MKKFYQQKNKNGYTIIETMVAISLFLVIVISGMGSFLNANVLHQKARDMRSIMDSLSFTMEDISRNLRTGYRYRCFDNSNLWTQAQAQTASLNTPRSCALGGVIVFEEAHGNTPTSLTPDPNATDQWAYKVESTDSGATFDISKSVDGGLTWVQLNPDEVVFNSISGFSVLGAEPVSSSNNQQPFVIIKLVGSITYKGVVTPFSMQTSASERLIDVGN